MHQHLRTLHTSGTEDQAESVLNTQGEVGGKEKVADTCDPRVSLGQCSSPKIATRDVLSRLESMNCSTFAITSRLRKSCTTHAHRHEHPVLNPVLAEGPHRGPRNNVRQKTKLYEYNDR